MVLGLRIPNLDEAIADILAHAGKGRTIKISEPKKPLSEEDSLNLGYLISNYASSLDANKEKLGRLIDSYFLFLTKQNFDINQFRKEYAWRKIGLPYMQK